MDGDSLLNLLKVWLNLILELVFLLAFPTLADTTMVFAKVLSMLLCVHGGLDKMVLMRKNDPVSKELTLRPWLYCKDLVSMQHIVLLGVTTLKRINKLLGLLISGRDCERHTNRGPIRISRLCDEISGLPPC